MVFLLMSIATAGSFFIFGQLFISQSPMSYHSALCFYIYANRSIKTNTQSTTMLKANNLTITLLLSIAFLFSGATHVVKAQSPVWEITKGDHKLYIGGTIHLLSQQDYPLPKAFDLAFENSDSLVFETDITAAGAIQTQSKILPTILIQDGTTLQSKLDAHTFSKLRTYLEQRNLPLAMFQTLTPAGINLTLLALELQKMGVNSQSGVESHFYGRAEKADKPVTWLESIADQIAVLETMNSIDPNVMINSTIDDMQNLPEQWPTLLQIWRRGDMPELEKLGLDTMIATSPELYQALVIKRNSNWVPLIRKMLDTPETELVLVGALHLAGDHSVLRLLADEELEITQLD